MRSHILAIRYDGFAAQHKNERGAKAVIGGANILLLALASYWTGEKLPDRLLADTPRYNFRHTAPRPGPIKDCCLTWFDELSKVSPGQSS
jgi:hypothetical protein